MPEFREKQNFKVQLRYTQKEMVLSAEPDEDPNRTPREWKAGEIVEVDLVGDPPGIMAVQDLVISGTNHFLSYDEYYILDDESES